METEIQELAERTAEKLKIGNYLLMMFYTVISGRLVWYFIEMAKGRFAGLTVAEVSGVFEYLLIILAVKSVILPNAETGLKYYLLPNFKAMREIGL